MPPSIIILKSMSSIKPNVIGSVGTLTPMPRGVSSKLTDSGRIKMFKKKTKSILKKVASIVSNATGNR